MAHKKGQGTSRNGRDSNAQRRGVKKYGDEYARKIFYDNAKKMLRKEIE